ncbi:uncharacterized protein LOC134217095 isoform X2 [Armigeres subalbatus]|uniref:uncharacterized protein LOC134217095 isoform X2 n=1 Tax=Armigeres subalbatus TaxID=124917 RepID=UPI002ED4D8B8
MESESSNLVAGSSAEDSVPKQEPVGDTGEKTASVVTFRNVNTQHGDHRTVDEANIVVFRICHSPTPSALCDDDGKEQQVIWFEEFVPPENKVSTTNPPFAAHTELNCIAPGGARRAYVCAY